VKLPYLDSVISETLRLYPPVLRLEREAMTDYKLGNTGITLLKGQLVEIPVFAIHHSEEYYPNPERFFPERFMPENRD
jgi:cytochrome P450 family 3 subfamily A